ncbi:MAG: hypothetical protein WBH50_17555 [Fuerstiella sp.]
MNERRTIVTDATPIMAETFYDRSTSALWTSIILLSMLCAGLILVWQQFLTVPKTGHPNPIDPPVPLEINSQYHEPQSPQFETNTSVPLDDEEPITETNALSLQELAITINLHSDSASGLTNDGRSNSNTGESGSSDLSNHGPLRSSRRSSRDHHWFFEVDAPHSESAYTNMLQQLGIQLAAVFPDGTIVYLENKGGVLSSRSESNIQQEQRYFTTWSGGDLQLLDEALFRSVGVDISEAKLVQLMPAELEEQLATMEAAYADREPEQIRRTWFRLSNTDTGFKFMVTQQTAQ